jgi:hypothetical protein
VIALLTRQQANNLSQDLLSEARPEWARLRRFVRYARGRQPGPWLPDSAESEYRDIARKSASNWIDLVIRATCQGLIVDGYEAGATGDGRDVWENAWQANKMDARQHSLHRAAGTLGYAFEFVLPADDGGVWMRPDAATEVWARYADPQDEWPVCALRWLNGKSTTGAGRWELYDGEARYLLEGTPGSASLVDVLAHELPVCPVVQVRWNLDLLGTPMGEVEPVVPIQDRIVDATFTLQMVAKYGAFPQRWIAGLNPAAPLIDPATGEPMTDPNTGELIYPKIKAYVDHIIAAADPDTKFGQFADANLDQYVNALEAHIRHLAAITQTPPHYLLGSLVNLSAEALAAAESGLQRKIREKREVIGEAHEQALGLAALVLGVDAAALDESAQVHWQDVESRSLAQVSDALLKLSQLGVPNAVLFRMIPGWTQEDADAAAALVPVDPFDALTDRLMAGAQSQPTTRRPEDVKVAADAMGVLIRSGVDSDSAAEQVGLDVEFTGAVPVSLRLPENDAADLEAT